MPPGSATSCSILTWCFKKHTTEPKAKWRLEVIFLKFYLLLGNHCLFSHRFQVVFKNPKSSLGSTVSYLTVLTFKVFLFLQITFWSVPLVGVSTLVPQHEFLEKNHRMDTYQQLSSHPAIAFGCSLTSADPLSSPMDCLALHKHPFPTCSPCPSSHSLHPMSLPLLSPRNQSCLFYVHSIASQHLFSLPLTSSHFNSHAASSRTGFLLLQHLNFPSKPGKFLG